MHKRSYLIQKQQSRGFFNFLFGGSKPAAAETSGISNEPPKRIAITGAAGNIAYSILFRLAAGQFLGPN
jgi:hypothetical protein